jgi:ribonuclease PH
MPKQLRWTIKRDCDIAINELSKAGNKLLSLYQLYNDGNHEEYAEMLKMAIEGIVEIVNLIKMFRDKI